MDVFYYWKNHEQDVKAGRLGHFASTSDKMQEMADGQPEYIWVFRTPHGRKGELQLLGRLRWRPQPLKGVHREQGLFYVYYEASHPDSVMFVDSDTDAAIGAVTHWVSHHFASMRSAGFKGASSQEALRGQPLKEIKAIAAGFATRPLKPAVEVPAAAAPAA